MCVAVVRLEEIIWGTSGDVGFRSSWCRVELQEGVFHVFVELHNGGLIAAAVAVVGRREDGNDGLLVTPIVALHDELMGSGNEGETIGAIELF